MLSRHRRVLLQFGARGGEFGFELAANLILLPFGGGEFHLAPCFQLIQARSQCRGFDRCGFTFLLTLLELGFNRGLLPLEFANLKGKFGDPLPFLGELIVLIALLDLIFVL